MTVTKDVILDLLPLYLADEVSDDTRILVEEFLEGDPSLAAIAQQPHLIEKSDNIPVPLAEENKMEAYKEAKRLQFWRTIIIAVIVSLTIMGLLVFSILVLFTMTNS